MCFSSSHPDYYTQGMTSEIHIFLSQKKPLVGSFGCLELLWHKTVVFRNTMISTNERTVSPDCSPQGRSCRVPGPPGRRRRASLSWSCRRPLPAARTCPADQHWNILKYFWMKYFWNFSPWPCSSLATTAPPAELVERVVVTWGGIFYQIFLPFYLSFIKC